jgi:hypothetical protein
MSKQQDAQRHASQQRMLTATTAAQPLEIVHMSVFLISRRPRPSSSGSAQRGTPLMTAWSGIYRNGNMSV